jgi:ubiquinone/menaquinone biosynthesis C-methylase UbiE
MGTVLIPKDIIEMSLKHIQITERTKVLDLAYGKGAVSVQAAKALGCRVRGRQGTGDKGTGMVSRKRQGTCPLVLQEK